MKTRMHMSKDGKQYRLVEIGLHYYIEDEDTRKCVDSRFHVNGWTATGRNTLAEWVKSLGYAITSMDPV